MIPRQLQPVLAVGVAMGVFVGGLFLSPWVLAQEEDLTRNVPIPDFQNRAEDVKPYDFDGTPEGLFYSIQTTEGFEEEVGIRRTHEIVPVNPTDTFPPDKPVFVVFRVYPHFESYQVLGRLYAEEVHGLDTQQVLREDAMYLALEDESGYLKFFPPDGGWQPGKYKVEIHVGWKVTEVSLMGAMRFTVPQEQARSDGASITR